jgi:hypothetical protein
VIATPIPLATHCTCEPSNTDEHVELKQIAYNVLAFIRRFFPVSDARARRVYMCGA